MERLCFDHGGVEWTAIVLLSSGLVDGKEPRAVIEDYLRSYVDRYGFENVFVALHDLSYVMHENAVSENRGTLDISNRDDPVFRYSDSPDPQATAADRRKTLVDLVRSHPVYSRIFVINDDIIGIHPNLSRDQLQSITKIIDDNALPM